MLRGTGVLRREDAPLLRGQGRFIDDRKLDRLVDVVYVVSPIAHARILSIDVAEAKQAPGVLDVITSAEVSELTDYPLGAPAFDEAMRRPMLARDVVRFVGEPIVGIVAETAAQAEDAASLVAIDFDPLQAIVDPEASLESSVRLFEGTDDNVAITHGDDSLSADFDACEVVVRQRVVNRRIAPCPIEPRTAIALWEDDRLIHYNAGQGVHPVRMMLAEIYGLEPAQLRVVCADVGGSFGAKARAHPEEVLLGLLSKRVGRPVRWVPPRSDDMVGLVHGRGQVQHITIGGTRDGVITAYGVRAVQDSGAYPMGGAGLPRNLHVMLSGCYDIAGLSFSSQSALTNTTPTGAYRGAGRPEAAAAIERAVDLFAAEIGMDPVEVRRKNFLQPDRFPHVTQTGTPYDNGEYETAMDRALAAAGYDELRAEQAQRRAAGDAVQLGIGIATYVERTAGVGGTEFGSAELLPDGRVLARTGSTPYGQGHHTSWAMLISDRTGIPYDHIEIVHGDTDVVPSGKITGGSRSVQIAGMAMWEAGGKLVEMARERAADLLEANVDDIELDTSTGTFAVVGTPSITVDWVDIARQSGPRTLHADTDYEPVGPTFPFGAHVAVVEVDTETGQVRLRRLVALDDAGVILNPLLADGQVHGGLAQGVAQAMLEEFVYDADGNPVTANLADYPAISATDLPMFERVLMETPTPMNVLGAKGIGEAGTVGSTPAVQNAVIDALSHLGVRHIDMPTTPERVWRAMNEAQR